jgi:hypothetical protein
MPHDVPSKTEAALHAARFTPAVTVLMSVREVPVEMLQQAVESVLRQSFHDFEFLLYDDGGRDPRLLEALEHYAFLDRRIVLCHEPPRGLTKTLNLGLGNARGRYVARHDADDWSEPDRFAQQVEYLDRNPGVAVCGSNAWMHQERGARLWPTALPGDAGSIRNALPDGNPFIHGATVFRTRAARAIGGYREEFVCSQDYDFFWRMCDAGGGANLPAPLYHYRFRRAAVSAQRAAEQARVHKATQALGWARRMGVEADVEAALEEAGRQLQQTPEKVGSLLKQADHRLLAGDYGGAMRAYLSLVGRYPASPMAWGKLLRWLIFRTTPPARPLCF